MVNAVLRGARRITSSVVRRISRIPDAIPRRILSREEKAITAQNDIFKDKHKGQRCFVIATGPSLKGQDIMPLESEITFVMSGFWKHAALDKWQPTYYCLCDPLYFDGSKTMKEFFKSVTDRSGRSTFFAP